LLSVAVAVQGVAAAALVGTGATFAALVITSSGPFANDGSNRADEDPAVVEVRTLAGSGPTTAKETPDLVDGAALQAHFDQPTWVALGKDGSIYVSDNAANAIRRIDQDGTVTTVAGGKAPGLRDGPAADAQFDDRSELPSRMTARSTSPTRLTTEFAA
jgi:hypothetical protein